jgi:hypothetical protein
MSAKILAQSPDFTLENIKAPTMPAAYIIGLQTSEVTSPKSLKTLEAAVYSNYLNSGQGLNIPNNYALEINPFMLSNRTNFDYRDYLKDDVPLNLWRNFSISIASTNKFVLSDSIASNAVGISFRTIVLNGEPNKDMSASFISLLDKDSQHSSILNAAALQIYTYKIPASEINIDELARTVCSGVKNNFKSKGELSASEESVIDYTILSTFKEIHTASSIRAVADSFDTIFKRKFVVDSLAQLKKKLAQIKSERYGVRWEIDGAIALNYPTNNFNYCVSPRWGLWTNVSYSREELNGLSFIGLVRMIINNDDFINKYKPVDSLFNTGAMYDFGLKLNYESGDLSLSIEYIYRLNANKQKITVGGFEYERTINSDTRKYVFSLSYNLTPDINISYNLGKDFNELYPKQGNLISGLTLNLGFGALKASDLLKKN